MANCLCNQAGWICKIDQPCLGTEMRNDLCLFHGNRDGAQGHCDSARPRRLLAWIAIEDCDFLIARAGVDAAYPNAIQNEGCTIDCIFDG
jgi:hypothetical protein